MGRSGTILKHALTRAGTHTPREALRLLGSGLNYLEVGRWMAERGFRRDVSVDRREQIFDVVAREVGDRSALYLEFGVHRGASMRYWSNILRSPRANLHGFDSFEGLPEPWDTRRGKGHFSTRGEPPRIDDPRVTFFKGWFDVTLASYKPPEHDVLVAALDADLYSSTICVLRALRPWLRRGSYLYFDEFCDRNHELLAFDEFLAETGLRFRLRAADRTLVHTLFECVG